MILKKLYKNITAKNFSLIFLILLTVIVSSVNYPQLIGFWESGIVEILSKDGEGKLDNTPGTWTQIDGNTVITSKTGSITIFPGLEPTAH